MMASFTEHLRYGEVDPWNLYYVLVGVHTPEYLMKNRLHMEKHGILNPILIISEHDLPPYVHSGVTRAHCAKLYDFTLMAIVWDPAGRYTHLPSIKPADVARKFPSGCIYNGFPQGIPDVAAMPVSLND